MMASLTQVTKVRVRAILIDPSAYDWYADFLERFVPHMGDLSDAAIRRLSPMLKNKCKIVPLIDLIEAWSALPPNQRKTVAESLRKDFDIPHPQPANPLQSVES